MQAFIEPDLRLAQIRIVNKFNPFSALLRPTYILKSNNKVDEKVIIDSLPGCTVTRESSYGTKQTKRFACLVLLFLS